MAEMDKVVQNNAANAEEAAAAAEEMHALSDDMRNIVRRLARVVGVREKDGGSGPPPVDFDTPLSGRDGARSLPNRPRPRLPAPNADA